MLGKSLGEEHRHGAVGVPQVSIVNFAQQLPNNGFHATNRPPLLRSSGRFAREPRRWASQEGTPCLAF
jgi:hypothetical protein